MYITVTSEFTRCLMMGKMTIKTSRHVSAAASTPSTDLCRYKVAGRCKFWPYQAGPPGLYLASPKNQGG